MKTSIGIFVQGTSTCFYTLVGDDFDNCFLDTADDGSNNASVSMGKGISGFFFCFLVRVGPADGFGTSTRVDFVD